MSFLRKEVKRLESPANKKNAFLPFLVALGVELGYLFDFFLVS